MSPYGDHAPDLVIRGSEYVRRADLPRQTTVESPGETADWEISTSANVTGNDVPEFPRTTIADKWVAKQLLRYGTSAPQVAAILRAGSPGFPRRHAHPEDYLSRTLARATLELEATPFSRRAAWLGNL
ncbi:MAG TPA: hypothetical protein VKB48_12460 [Candidatus Acidoferrum sp.]|nr:hypothetical protein [Candidatus Acidoferrum sp.]